MGWGGDVNVPSATRSLDLAQDVDATLTWGGVGLGDVSIHPTLHKTLMLHQWGGVDGAMTTLIRLCARL